MHFVGNSLEIVKLNESQAKITLRVKEEALSCLKAFSEDEKLLTFLTDPYDSDPARRGCRLDIKISLEKRLLELSRDMKKQTTFPRVAYLDLVKTIEAFIWHRIPEASWEDLLRGHKALPFVEWQRAESFRRASV